MGHQMLYFTIPLALFAGIGDPFLALTLKKPKENHCFWLRTLKNLRKTFVFAFPRASGDPGGTIGPTTRTVQYCTVLYSTVQYCTVLYSTVQYFLLVMIKKIKNAPRSASWAKRVFDFFSRIFTRYIKKSIKRNSNNSSFRRFLKKSLWNHFKKSETFTNRSGLKNQYQRWVSCTLFVGRMTISLKNTEMFKRNTIFEGADFRNFQKSRFLDFCPLHPIQFSARIFTVATRN